MCKHLLLTVASALLAGCGYVGDPLPPALRIPERVEDLRAIQRGGDLLIDFTAPALTTEALPIREFEAVELRVGPLPDQFSLDQWASTAKPVPATAEPGKPVHVELPAKDWTGREVFIAVRLKNANGRLSEWSNGVTLMIRKPLETPSGVTAEPHREGIRVSWKPSPPETSLRVYRETAGQARAVIGTVSADEFIDRDVTVGRPYEYSVQALADGLESEPSPAVSVVPRDVFPPAPPTGLTAVAGLGSVELTWERTTDADLRSYRVYRAAGSDDFTLFAEAVNEPAFSDRQLSSGTAYRYQVTAVDQSGNESQPSSVVEVKAP